MDRLNEEDTVRGPGARGPAAVGAAALPTAGAVPVRTADGKLTMQKVKVNRYVAGVRPTYAAGSDSESDSERQRKQQRPAQRHRHSARPNYADVFDTSQQLVAKPEKAEPDDEDVEVRDGDDVVSRKPRRRWDDTGEAGRRRDEQLAQTDSRLRRLARVQRERSRRSRRDGTGEDRARASDVEEEEEEEDEEEDGRERSRRAHEPAVVASGAVKDEADSDDSEARARHARLRRRHRSPDSDEEKAENDSDLSDTEIERHRQALREKALRKRKEEQELLGPRAPQPAEGSDISSSESEGDTDEEYTSDENDTTAPRLKPVFVPKRDRVTLKEAERERVAMEKLEIEKKHLAEERKRQSSRIVELLVKKEVESEQKARKEESGVPDLETVKTDDEDEQVAYEAWKLRELKRIKRDKDEAEAREKEQLEIARVHDMTEEERRAYLRANPKVVTNQQERGKYKFMQKYFHRGVFYLDEEDTVYKRNFAEPTLEDRFDKTVLPKVMQVKDFGKAGRTKWTHLVAEDTTDFQAAWAEDTANNLKFYHKHAAGVKEVFDRPAKKKKLA